MTDSKDKSLRNEYLLYVLIWTSVAILPLGLQLWDHINTTAGFDWKPVIRWWTGMIPLVIIFILHNHVLIPRFLKKGRTIYYSISLCVILLTFGCLSYYSDNDMRERPVELPPPHHGMDPGFRPSAPFPQSPDGFQPGEPKGFRPAHGRRPPVGFPFPLLFKMVLVLLTIGANAAISLSFGYHREQTDRMALEEFRLQEELKYLKQQISPHFLMNVLNNIHEMAYENVAKAQEMILELSQLMRYVLYESENEKTDLVSEAKFISSYVGLMKMRYLEDIVKINLELPEETDSHINIPPLLFISFIENAFKHGVSYLNDTVIDIKLYEMNGKVLFSCDNTIPARTAETDGKGGVGLANVRRRLDLLYGENYSLKIHQDNNRYSVTLLIPSI